LAHKIFKLEFFALFLLSIFGQLICISSINLLLTYVGIELMALAIYGIVAFNNNQVKAIEAGIKYMVLGAVASAFLLYGTSMLYGSTGSLDYRQIYLLIADNGVSSSYNHNLLLFGVLLIISGLCFKLGLVPFHMWAPDVYEGGNSASTLIVSTMPKIAIFAMTYRLLVDTFDILSANFIIILQVIAIASLLIGSLTAIMQTNIKRMLAYSTISHMGFVLLAMTISYDTSLEISTAGKHSAVFYTLVYTFSGAAMMAIIVGLTNKNDDLKLENIKGLAKKNPWLGIGFLISVFSLAGIPPTIGFYAKFLVIQNLIQSGMYVFAIIAVLSSVIAAFYYLRIIKAIYFDEADENTAEFTHANSAKILLCINIAGILALGIYPQGLISFISYNI
jgi:NADH-quinone oxidoreductase subunit N